MYSGKHDVMMAAVQKEVADLDPAELVLVADYIQGIKLARKFRKQNIISNTDIIRPIPRRLGVILIVTGDDKGKPLFEGFAARKEGQYGERTDDRTDRRPAEETVL